MINMETKRFVIDITKTKNDIDKDDIFDILFDKFSESLIDVTERNLF